MISLIRFIPHPLPRVTEKLLGESIEAQNVLVGPQGVVIGMAGGADVFGLRAAFGLGNGVVVRMQDQRFPPAPLADVPRDQGGLVAGGKLRGRFGAQHGFGLFRAAAGQPVQELLKQGVLQDAPDRLGVAPYPGQSSDGNGGMLVPRFQEQNDLGFDAAEAWHPLLEEDRRHKENTLRASDGVDVFLPKRSERNAGKVVCHPRCHPKLPCSARSTRIMALTSRIALP